MAGDRDVFLAYVVMALFHVARESKERRWLEAGIPQRRTRAQKDIELDPEGYRKPWKNFEYRMISIL